MPIFTKKFGGAFLAFRDGQGRFDCNLTAFDGTRGLRAVLEKLSPRTTILLLPAFGDRNHSHIEGKVAAAWHSLVRVIFLLSSTTWRVDAPSLRLGGTLRADDAPEPLVLQDFDGLAQIDENGQSCTIVCLPHYISRHRLGLQAWTDSAVRAPLADAARVAFAACYLDRVTAKQWFNLGEETNLCLCRS